MAGENPFFFRRTIVSTMLCLHDPLTLGRLPPQRLLGYHVANQTDNVDVGLSHEVPPKNPMPRIKTTLIVRVPSWRRCAQSAAAD